MSKNFSMLIQVLAPIADLLTQTFPYNLTRIIYYSVALTLRRLPAHIAYSLYYGFTIPP